jgi:hypothetical protein
MSEQREDFIVREVTQERNGHTPGAVLERAAEPAVMTQRMPVRIRRVELVDDYAGWWADMHVNPPIGVILAMEGNPLGVLEQMPKIITMWNFGDADGQPLPITPEGIRALPDDLLKALADGYSQARGLPKATSST